ncbi:MAG: DUF1254 domain-containing protein [Pseudomonadota bacterium]
MRLIIAVMVFAVCACAGHFFVLSQIPGLVIGKAHQALQDQGIGQNVWVQTPRQTPQSQRIVRPSPDIAYAICRFDTRDGPVRISAPTWDGYGSLSIFNDRTDNVFVQDLSEISTFDGITVRRRADDSSPDALILDGDGIALIRRLAPTQDAFDRAAVLVADARCDAVE